MKILKRLISFVPMLALLALLTLLVPVIRANEPLCCYGKVNLPIDQQLATYEVSMPFGFTVYTTPLPPYFIYRNLDLEYTWYTICFGGCFILGDSNFTGTMPDQIAQINMLVQKFSALTGSRLGLLTGFAVGPPNGNPGPPEWIETANIGYNCPI